MNSSFNLQRFNGAPSPLLSLPPFFSSPFLLGVLVFSRTSALNAWSLLLVHLPHLCNRNIGLTNLQAGANVLCGLGQLLVHPTGAIYGADISDAALVKDKGARKTASCASPQLERSLVAPSFLRQVQNLILALNAHSFRVQFLPLYPYPSFSQCCRQTTPQAPCTPPCSLAFVIAVCFAGNAFPSPSLVVFKAHILYMVK